jgi:diacylglycerol kinase (ATP)
MRAAAILGLGTSLADLRLFQENSLDDWMVGLPSNADGIDAVLVFGGDGTVHRHLSALARLGLPVLVVPAGSGNDFARSLGLLKLSDSLAAWREFSVGRGRERAIDLGCVTALDENPNANPAQHYFACVGSVGLDADIARRANGLPRWLRKSGGYALSLPPALFSFAPFATKVWLAKETAENDAIARETLSLGAMKAGARANLELRSDRPTVLVAFANTPFYGDGMKIAPKARLDDGRFDVCLIRAMDKFKLLCLFPTVYFGRHLNVREVEYFQAARAVIEAEYPLDVYADGEFVCRTPAEFRVERAALRVIVGERASSD